jgi:hypothetical protein
MNAKIKRTGTFVLNWLLARLSEPSTYRGLVFVFSAAGVSLSPDQSAAIITAGGAAIGLIEVFRAENQSQQTKGS